MISTSENPARQTASPEFHWCSQSRPIRWRDPLRVIRGESNLPQAARRVLENIARLQDWKKRCEQDKPNEDRQRQNQSGLECRREASNRSVNLLVEVRCQSREHLLELPRFFAQCKHLHDDWWEKRVFRDSRSDFLADLNLLGTICQCLAKKGVPHSSAVRSRGL